MRHLVTGAGGFIGFHLARKLLERGDEVVGIDSLNDYYDPRLKVARLEELGVQSVDASGSDEVSSRTHPRFRFARLSLEDQPGMEGLFTRHAFDAVCNLAAQAGVRYSLLNPRAYVSSNISGFLNVLECCRQSMVPHLLYASSSSVYGSDSSQPSSTQDRADHPLSMYAATKRANELMAHAYGQAYGLATTGLRFFTVYGPWGRPDMAYYRFAESILSGASIDVYNNGDMRRDFTYVEDAVDAVVRILGRTPAAGDPRARVYNIGNSHPESLEVFISLLETALGKKAVRRNLPMQAGDVQSTWADVSDLERDFGWKPSTSLRDGLVRFVEWYRNLPREGKA